MRHTHPKSDDISFQGKKNHRMSNNKYSHLLIKNSRDVEIRDAFRTIVRFVILLERKVLAVCLAERSAVNRDPWK